ncbi:MAG TPA: hypothetical protein QF528_05755, partial [Phycisphaerales bacterium]|nr:hypothetical protein [Phycisphaerales bacterium]
LIGITKVNFSKIIVDHQFDKFFEFSNIYHLVRISISSVFANSAAKYIDLQRTRGDLCLFL